MPGFQSTRLATEGALEPFFFLYTDDSIHGNPETCKRSSIMLNYEVKNIYILLCIIILRQKFNTFSISINILFWFIFNILLLIIQPEHTTLDAIDLSDIPIQWIILEIIGCVTFCINCIFILNRYFEKKRIC